MQGSFNEFYGALRAFQEVLRGDLDQFHWLSEAFQRVLGSGITLNSSTDPLKPPWNFSGIALKLLKWCSSDNKPLKLPERPWKPQKPPKIPFKRSCWSLKIHWSPWNPFECSWNPLKPNEISWNALNHPSNPGILLKCFWNTLKQTWLPLKQRGLNRPWLSLKSPDYLISLRTPLKFPETIMEPRKSFWKPLLAVLKLPKMFLKAFFLKSHKTQPHLSESLLNALKTLPKNLFIPVTLSDNHLKPPECI